MKDKTPHEQFSILWNNIKELHTEISTLTIHYNSMSATNKIVPNLPTMKDPNKIPDDDVEERINKLKKEIKQLKEIK